MNGQELNFCISAVGKRINNSEIFADVAPNSAVKSSFPCVGGLGVESPHWADDNGSADPYLYSIEAKPHFDGVYIAWFEDSNGNIFKDDTLVFGNIVVGGSNEWAFLKRHGKTIYSNNPEGLVKTERGIIGKNTGTVFGVTQAEDGTWGFRTWAMWDEISLLKIKGGGIKINKIN